MKQAAADGIAQFLTAFGVDLSGGPMKDTPKRVATLYEKLFEGLQQDTASLWGDVYPTDYQGLVAVTQIDFISICEHHLVPFLGKVDVIYHPKDGRVVGLSKMDRLVKVLSHRPQLQERLTKEIADAICKDLQADGVLVRIRAEHMCMLLKEEIARGTEAVTIETRGTLAKGGSYYEEALQLLGGEAR